MTTTDGGLVAVPATEEGRQHALERYGIDWLPVKSPIPEGSTTDRWLSEPSGVPVSGEETMWIVDMKRLPIEVRRRLAQRLGGVPEKIGLKTDKWLIMASWPDREAKEEME